MTLKRVLVTGCNGFIGTAQAEQCLSRGWLVRGSVRSQEKKDRLPANVETAVTGEIGPDTDWSGALADVDAVVHLAAAVHDFSWPRKIDQTVYLRVNTAGTARLARACARAGVKRLVFLSTIKVQGEGGGEGYTEKDPEDPRDPYAASKLEAEHALKEIAGRTRLEVVILRPPLVYGPGVRANFLRLIRLVERRIPLPLADVENRRSLIYVGNLTDAILACLDNAAAAGRTYLVADDRHPSTPELISAIAAELGVAPNLWRCPLRLLRAAAALLGKKGEAQRLTQSLWADTSRIRQELGWTPPYSLCEGIAATVKWYQGAGRPAVQ